jgi:hypothetical protein
MSPTLTKLSRTGLLVITFTVLSPSGQPAFGQDVTLQYRWSKGEDVKYRVVQQTTSQVSGLPGVGEMNVEMNMSQVLRARVDDIAADGAATVTYVYESVRWDMKSPMGMMSFDSAAADSPGASAVPAPMKQALSALIGESFVVVMSRRGQVMKVEGMNLLMEKMFKTIPPDPNMAPVMEGLKKSFSDDSMRGMFAQGQIQFPDRALKPGDTWEQEQSMTNPIAGRMTTTTIFTLKAIDTSGSRVARISTTSTIKSDPNAGTTGPMGLKIQLGDGTGEGELMFDIAAGRLLRSETRMTMPTQMSMPGPDGSAMNLKSVATSVIAMELIPAPIGH